MTQTDSKKWYFTSQFFPFLYVATDGLKTRMKGGNDKLTAILNHLGIDSGLRCYSNVKRTRTGEVDEHNKRILFTCERGSQRICRAAYIYLRYRHSRSVLSQMLKGSDQLIISGVGFFLRKR